MSKKKKATPKVPEIPQVQPEPNDKPEVTQPKAEGTESKPEVVEPTSEVVEPTAEVTIPKAEATEPEAVEPKPEIAKPLTLADIQQELETLKQVISEHTQQITDLQSKTIRKKKAVSNGKVQIRDKTTGMVYPSKNSTYKTLLKAEELKELVDKGVFGDDPEKNTFGWYALKREWPERFEEVKA